AALALGCEIPGYCKFDRKNYFYPDSTKGFQISHFDEPLSQKGTVEFEIGDRKVKVGVTRLHLEDDAGKLTHVRNGSLVDSNRAGTPLMEIVSEPDMHSPDEAEAYAREVQKILRYVGSSEADMEKGMMRFDASVSIRPKGETKLYHRAEIKNLNSFKALESAITFEIKRQKKLWEEEKIPKKDTTVGWDDKKGETYLMREKESASDYRYFPEPDIPPLILKKEKVEEWKKTLPELPLVKRERFVQQFGVSEEDAKTLTNSKALANYFEKVTAISGDVKKSAAWILSELLARMKEDELKIEEQKISAENLGNLVKKIASGEISGKIGKEIFPEMWERGVNAEEIIKAKGLKQISDSGEIEKFVEKAIAANTEAVADFRNGKERALGRIVGEVMKLSKGQANPAMVNGLIRKKLG
ncbi:Asp-tRNA(Asn)/Glu-tRNA(Gln) amidotransferase subunit GatB, partial [Candidatus Gracilibacteria bacterium]|nr:Asp-tRNA(Asn)/Glu-tRNA(Gln) amidotransferase subunit GatB [Candidatus Gracilibacteria bacterium]